MISILTSTGSKDLLLRGIMTADGAVDIGAAHITVAADDYQFWDASDYAALTVAIAPPYVTGGGASPSAITIDTAIAYASAGDATAPVTWLWEVVTVDSGTWTILTASASATAFRCSGVTAEATRSATFKVTATDARGATGTAQVYVEATNYGGF